MQRRRIVLVLAFVLTSGALAGCLGGDDAPQPAQPPASTQPPQGGDGEGSTPTPNATAPPTPPPNRPPEVGFGASVTTGTVPLKVAFHINATDPDEDDRNHWRLDIDDDGVFDYEGDAFPAAPNHTFETVGNHTVFVNVTDGDSFVEGNITITVTEPPPPEVPAPKRFRDNITGAYVGVGGQGGYLDDEGNNHTWSLDVPVEEINITIEWDQLSADLDFFVWAPDGQRAGRANDYNEPTGLSGYNVTEAPVLIQDPAFTRQTGTWAIQVLSAGSVESAYTVTIRFA